MTEAEWLTCARPSEMWEHLARTGTERKFRLCAIALCRRLPPSSLNEQVSAVLAIAERVADALANEAERFAAEWSVKGSIHPAIGYAIALEPSVELVTDATFCYAPEDTESAIEAAIVRDIFGNPFRPVAFSPQWRTDTAVALARTMYDSRDFSAMPILADALQDAGCDNADVLDHCRDVTLAHVRGCWVVDLVLAKQ